MDPARKIIAEWLRGQMERLNWTPQAWADRADTSATNITRALKADEKPVMTFKTQDLLARAAGVPSALDYLAGNAPEPLPGGAAQLSAETWEIVLPTLLQASAGVELPASSVRPTAAALQLLIELIGESPAIHASPDALKAVVLAAASRPRGSMPEA